MTRRSRILEEIQETAQGLLAAGVIDKRRMEEYAALGQTPPVPRYDGEGVKALRSRFNVSQTALAMLLNTSPATVRAWELGAKKPGGPSCKLLQILDRKGPEALL